MKTTREIAFIDPAVPDIASLLAGLRPDLEAYVLDGRTSALEEIAGALEARGGTDTIHIIAHGAPGEVHFASNILTLEGLSLHTSALETIGRLLDDGEINLWSCETAAGAAGQSFVHTLSGVTGVPVAAATRRVGSVRLGGAWNLDAADIDTRRAAPEPPLTAAGLEAFDGVLAHQITISGPIPQGPTTRQITYAVVDKSTNAIVGSITLPDAATFAQSFRLVVNVARPSQSFDCGLFDETGRFTSAGFDIATPFGGAAGAAA